MKLNASWPALRSAISWHRRKLAAVATAVAVLAVVTAVRPDTTTVSVLVITRSLPGGTAVSSADVVELHVPTHLVPHEHIESLPPGAVLAGPVTAHTILTSASLAGGQRLARPGYVIVPFSLPDRSLAPLLTVGSSVDVIGPDGVIVAGARVVSGVSDAAEPGLLGGFPTDSSTILLEVKTAQAAALATAQNSSGLTVALT